MLIVNGRCCKVWRTNCSVVSMVVVVGSGGPTAQCHCEVREKGAGRAERATHSGDEVGTTVWQLI